MEFRPNDDSSDVAPPSEKQIGAAETLAAIKGLDIPEGVRTDRRQWWGWINQNIDRRDQDIANTMRADFGIDCDLNNPISVIGALRYNDMVVRREASAEELRVGKARDLLLRGQDPYSIAELLNVSDNWIFKIISQVEAEGHRVEYG